MQKINIKNKKELVLTLMLSTNLYLIQFILIPLMFGVDVVTETFVVVSSLIYLFIVLVKNIRYSYLLLGFLFYAVLAYVYVVPFSYEIGTSMAYSFSEGPLVYDTGWAFIQKSFLLFVQFLGLNGGVLLKKLIIFGYKKIRKTE